MDNMKHGGGVIVNVSSLSGEKEKKSQKVPGLRSFISSLISFLKINWWCPITQ